MILWTFQNHQVLNNINEIGTHLVTWEDVDKFTPHQHAIPFYKELSNHLGYCNSPIWTFYTYDGKLIDDVEEFKNTCYHNYGVLLKLDVPDDTVTLTSYFDWSDYIFFSEELLHKDTHENRKMKELSWRNTFELEGVDRIQALIPFIKKEWVVGIY